MNRINELEFYFDKLWPILRSITGEGVRQTHDIISSIIPLNRHEIPTGTKIYDWEIPKEWVVKDAYVITPNGEKILDVKKNNLHLLNYSIPFSGTLSLDELDQHLYSISEIPDAVPYVTSYYKPKWGFCLSQNQRNKLKKGNYKIIIDTALIDGSLTISDLIIKGESKKEILIHTYTCHPSLANNELSGPLVATFLAKELLKINNLYYTYRFVFAPESIGAISYLHKYGEHFKKYLVAGYICSTVGDPGNFQYKLSRTTDSMANKAALYALNNKYGDRYKVHQFSASGSDERQYCSPGFKLPVGHLTRTIWDEYKEYHTSLDNKDLISFTSLDESIDLYLEICQILEMSRIYINKKQETEPMLSKYINYGTKDTKFADDITLAAKWCIHYCDGNYDLLDISNKSGLPLKNLYKAAEILYKIKLFDKI